MKTEEKDIVNVGAFNVVKRDFLASLDHDNNELGKALGAGEFDKKGTFEFLMGVMGKSDCYSKGIEVLMERATSLNQFVHLMYLYLQLRNSIENDMEKTTLPFGRMLTLPKNEDISESLKRVDDFLSKMFKDMRKGNEED